MSDKKETQDIIDFEEKLKAHRPAEDGKRRQAVMKSSASAGLEFAAVIIFCTFGGIWLDKQLGTGPIIFFTAFILGVVVAFYNLYRASEQLDQIKPNSELPESEKHAKTTPKLEESIEE
jgi:F0F1-type ATP synthase assembly protein I